MGRRRKVLRSRVLQILVSLTLLAALAACSKPPEAAPDAALQTPKPNGLDSVPAPDPAKYSQLRDLKGWQNPYLIVREDGIGLVDLSNHEVHILKPDEVPAELTALPSSAWPYGRVVLVSEAVPRIPTAQAKAEVRKNRGLLAGTLKQMNVQIREAP
jgi:hypothetical protein